MAELMEEGLNFGVGHQGGLAGGGLGEIGDHGGGRLFIGPVFQEAALDDGEGRGVGVLAVSRVEVEVEVADEATIGGIGDFY
ncbi:MAG: hypothetical protein AAB262_03610 [Elusimicrobiota bacterium]